MPVLPVPPQEQFRPGAVLPPVRPQQGGAGLLVHLPAGALEGAGIGWLIVLLSVPFNLICAILGIRGTRRVVLSLYPASATTSPLTPDDEPAAPSPVQA